LHIFLNTLWLSILFDKAFILITQTRILKALIMLPIEVITLSLTWKYLGTKIEKEI